MNNKALDYLLKGVGIFVLIAFLGLSSLPFFGQY